MLPEGASPTTAELALLSLGPSEAEQPMSTMHVSWLHIITVVYSPCPSVGSLWWIFRGRRHHIQCKEHIQST